jgi:protein tyrosine/serine phosphatase
MFFGLLLSLLGADDETIAQEYNLTEIGIQEIKEAFIQNIVARLKEWDRRDKIEEKPDTPSDTKEREAKWRQMAERSVSAK